MSAPHAFALALMVGATFSALLACAATSRRSAFLSARLRRAAGHEALRFGAVAVSLMVGACALALA